MFQYKNKGLESSEREGWQGQAAGAHRVLQVAVMVLAHPNCEEWRKKMCTPTGPPGSLIEEVAITLDLKEMA